MSEETPAKRRPGRPHGTGHGLTDARVEVRLTAAARLDVDEAVRLSGLSQTAWLRRVVAEAAARELRGAREADAPVRDT